MPGDLKCALSHVFIATGQLLLLNLLLLTELDNVSLSKS